MKDDSGKERGGKKGVKESFFQPLDRNDNC